MSSHFVSHIPSGNFTIVPRADHAGRLTMPLVEEATHGFRQPALFKAMVPIRDIVHTRAFYEEIDPTERLVWRRQKPGVKVDPNVGYDYVKGEDGPASDFLDQIFEEKVNVYSHLGPLSIGLNTPGHTWGQKAFRHLQKELFREKWFDIESWKLTGHFFFGRTDTEFGEVSDGFPGSDWHMVLTLNLFVMVAGLKKWMGFPPRPTEQLDPDLFVDPTGNARSQPKDLPPIYTICVEPGDVLVNLPYEWHKVLNAPGLSCGAAFRIKDVAYLRRLAEKRMASAGWLVGVREGREVGEAIAAFMSIAASEESTEDHDWIAHTLTSQMYASKDPVRGAQLLNWAEQVSLANWLRTRR